MLANEATNMPVIGEFLVLSYVQVLEAMIKDGLPRFRVLDEPGMASMLSDGEVAAKDEYLYLEPSAHSMFYYMNSSSPDSGGANLEVVPVYSRAISVDGATVRETLTKSSNGVAFRIKRDIKKGEEIVFFYPIFNKEGLMQYNDEWVDPLNVEDIEEMDEPVDLRAAAGGDDTVDGKA